MRDGGGDEGQAAVELALVLPLVALLLLGLVQVGLVVRDQVLLTHAAREAARQAAVDPSPQAARQAVLAGAPLAKDRLDVQLTGPGQGDRVTVRLSFRSPTTVPLVGPLTPDVVLGAQASMRAEGRDPSGWDFSFLPRAERLLFSPTGARRVPSQERWAYR